MSATESIAAIVRDIVRARVSRIAAGEEIPDDITLGEDGLGLDSIAIAEVVLDCELRFGVGVAALLEGEPLTLTRLVTHLIALLQQETPA